MIWTHLWQSTIFAAAAGLLTLVLKSNSARTRYWVWFAAVVKFLVPFAALVSFGARLPFPHWASASPTLVEPTLSPVLSLVLGETGGAPAVARVVPQAANLHVLEILFAIWICGGLIVGLRWLHLWLRVRAEVRAASPLRTDYGIPAVSSAVLREPGVFGIFRPVLLLPEAMAEHLSGAEWDAIITHELCHVRCYDNATALIYMLVETIFWFHPLVWWMGARLVAERERACDEEVLRRGSEPTVYAEGILKVCELYLESPLECVAGVTGSDLKRRVRAIMTHRGTVRLSSAKKLLLTAAGAVALVAPVAVGIVNAPVLRAQAQADGPPLTFEAASIRRSPDQKKQFVLHSPGTLLTNASVRRLMESAYSLQEFQVLNGPEWSNSVRWQISAKGEGNAGEAKLYRMLRSLLEDRFQLQTHREMRELPVYRLVTAKGGAKLKLPKDTTCNHALQSEFTGGRMALPGEDTPQQVACGGVDVILQAGGARMEGGNVSMPEFVRQLSIVLGRTVVDTTGYPGFFDVRLDFLPDDSTPALPAPPPGAATDVYHPSILTAMEEQLGLRLEAGKGPVEVMVIDHVENLSPN